MNKVPHDLERELYDLIKRDQSIFDFLQEGSLDGIWYWDLEAPESEWMSPRFWELLGYDPAEKKHLASEWQDLIFPDDLKTAIENLTKHCEDPSHPYDQVVRYRHKNGSTVWVRCRGIAIRDDSGQPIRLLGAHTDLTPLKRAEEMLELKAQALTDANRKLKKALKEITLLQDLLPICSYCKKIRDSKGSWHRIEEYISRRTGSQFTHGICPDCLKETDGNIDRDVER